MTLQEQFNLLEEDAIFSSLKEAYLEHPMILMGWDECMRTGRMPVEDFSIKQIESLRLLMRVMADRAEELLCNDSAAYWRGQYTGKREMNLPRSKWINEFMS